MFSVVQSLIADSAVIVAFMSDLVSSLESFLSCLLSFISE